MHCPNPSCYESPDRPHLLISERSGIEIDYCPKCRGVWLDRGELDKLIERAQEEVTPAPQAQQTVHDHRPQQHQDQHYRPQHDYKEQRHYDSQRKHYDDDRKHHNYGGHYGKPYKKKSILSEIFDF
ncbi:TFIIB-type zinc ribbon-containing protein [Cellvibrio mixtus]|uniref:TFIIB-type zinc ribbon-containing protein n=1 Tax=Cellvibrio mixtus TaxID=39650 RepID=UPI000586C7FC|nr:zf-TFIIB domain-containing protein [Cellvibrio mixtus]